MHGNVPTPSISIMFHTSKAHISWILSVLCGTLFPNHTGLLDGYFTRKIPSLEWSPFCTGMVSNCSENLLHIKLQYLMEELQWVFKHVSSTCVICFWWMFSIRLEVFRYEQDVIGSTLGIH
jgi:hypothetical protein